MVQLRAFEMAVFHLATGAVGVQPTQPGADENEICQNGHFVQSERANPCKSHLLSTKSIARVAPRAPWPARKTSASASTLPVFPPLLKLVNQSLSPCPSGVPIHHVYRAENPCARRSLRRGHRRHQ